jgi:hypothetical protein
MEKTQKSELLDNGEYSKADNYFPFIEERVVAEILIPTSWNIILKQIIFPTSAEENPVINILPEGKKVIPSILSGESKQYLVNKIIYDGKEEKIELEILITETGKIVMRGINYLNNGEVTMDILYPYAKVNIKTNIIFSSMKMFETKRILFPDSLKI